MFPDCPQVSLTDGNEVARYQLECLVCAADLIHVDQKALMAPQKPLILKFGFNGVQCLVKNVLHRIAGLLCVLLLFQLLLR